MIDIQKLVFLLLTLYVPGALAGDARDALQCNCCNDHVIALHAMPVLEGYPVKYIISNGIPFLVSRRDGRTVVPQVFAVFQLNVIFTPEAKGGARATRGQRVGGNILKCN